MREVLEDGQFNVNSMVRHSETRFSQTDQHINARPYTSDSRCNRGLNECTVCNMRAISSLLPEQCTLRRFINFGSAFISMPEMPFNHIKRAATR